jgi:hypothetical protein
MQRLNSALTALAVGIVLLTALDFAAAAATGRGMVLGQWNQADHKTVLKNTKQGVALDLRAKNGPVLKVGNSMRIKNLNADKLDGMTGGDYKTNRNTIYYWGTASHTGGFSQALPPQEPGSYLVTYSVQLTGAAGDPASPNVINCRVVQSGVSGAATFDKAIIGESTVTSVGTPPALNGTGPIILAAGDGLRLSCTMTRNNQQWSTTSLQPLTVNLLRTDGTDLYGGVLARGVALKRTAD